MDMFKPVFNVGEVAAVAGVASNTIRAWHARGQLQLRDGIVEPEATGLPRLFSANSAMIIGLATALGEAGVPVPRAIAAAERFITGGGNGRAVGAPFDDGETAIVVPANGNQAQFVNVLPDTPARNLFRRAFFGQGGALAATIVMVDEVYATLLSRLEQLARNHRPDEHLRARVQRARELA